MREKSENAFKICKVGVFLVILSLILPWASRMDVNLHFFLFGRYVPDFGFGSYSVHWFWMLPLCCVLLGSLLTVAWCLRRKATTAFLAIIGCIMVLFACSIFLLWFQPFKSPAGTVIVTLAAVPSFGFFLAVLGTSLILADVTKELIEWWSVEIE